MREPRFARHAWLDISPAQEQARAHSATQASGRHSSPPHALPAQLAGSLAVTLRHAAPAPLAIFPAKEQARARNAPSVGHLRRLQQCAPRVSPVHTGLSRGAVSPAMLGPTPTFQGLWLVPGPCANQGPTREMCRHQSDLIACPESTQQRAERACVCRVLRGHIQHYG